MKPFNFKFIFLALGGLFVQSVFAQDTENQTMSISGYVEVYYAYDFNRPENNTRPGFVYSFNRHNEFNVNLGYIKAAYHTDRVRANLALMTGTYANANLAAEPGVLKNVYEANTGVKFSANKDLWMDAGIFASHIGFESANGKDCWNLTRSILADNTPYYEAGAKISYTTDNGKWFLSGLILNGWQRIQRVEGNSLPSFGTQITFKPNSSVTLNSSTFIGADQPDSARLMRYFHNFYGIFQATKKIGLTVGFDYGVQQRRPAATTVYQWLSPVMIARYSVNNKVAFSIRGEYYDDEHGIIVVSDTPSGFRTTGVSANIDYLLLPNAMWRVEVRNFNSKDEYFTNESGSTKTNTFIATSLAISF